MQSKVVAAFDACAGRPFCFGLLIASTWPGPHARATCVAFVVAQLRATCAIVPELPFAHAAVIGPLKLLIVAFGVGVVGVGVGVGAFVGVGVGVGDFVGVGLTIGLGTGVGGC